MNTQTSGRFELSLEGVHRVAVLVNVALIGSLISYAMIVEILKNKLNVYETLAPLDVIRAVFFAVGIGLVLAVKYLRGVLLTKTPGEASHLLVTKVQRYSIIAAMFSETPGVLGLVLFMMGGARTDFYILLIMSLGMFAVNFPRLSRWKEWLGSAHQTVH
jgi:ABC-type Mn2+/Zn2+ transport system permease subunit